MKRLARVVALVLVALLAFSIIGCSSETEQAGEDTTKQAKVAAVFLGPVSDGGWNSAGILGLEQITQQFGWPYSYSEVGFSDAAQAFKDYGTAGYDLVFGHTPNFEEAAAQVAGQFPNTKFVIVAGNTTAQPGLPNISSFAIKWEEVGFVSGALAGLVTETNKIGVILGMGGPNERIIEESFKNGVQHVNPNAEVTVSYTGTYDDIAKGKEAALAQISAGADVVFHNAGWCGYGMIQAAKEKGVKAIGFARDQNGLAPDTVISSMVLKFPEMYVKAADLFNKGELEGKLYVNDLSSGGIGLAPFYGLVPQETQDAINQLQQDIIDGKVIVPAVDITK